MSFERAVKTAMQCAEAKSKLLALTLIARNARDQARKAHTQFLQARVLHEHCESQVTKIEAELAIASLNYRNATAITVEAWREAYDAEDGSSPIAENLG